MAPACILPIPRMDGQSRKTMQNLPGTLPSLMGFNKYLTPNWIESVSHIIKELPPNETKTNVTVQMAQNIGPDDAEADAEVAKIQGNIRVFCRVRPFHHEESYQCRSLFTLDESNVFLKVAETKIKQYKFDKVFNQSSTQGDIFAEVEPVIKSALDGYNVCIFAYGQTGSGKTYTMEGKPTSTDLGVIPRGIQAIFDRASENNRRFLFTFSMLEIYMGNLRDLLVPRSKTHGFKKEPSLSIKTDPDGGIEIENLVAVTVNSFQEVKRLYEVGTRLRSTAYTMANSTSSRSHCLIRLSLTCFDAPERKKATNKLWMIDLGGSERLVKTKATGKRLKEGKAINLSLSALGDVIDALQTKKAHVPYRNSKLTQVLRDSLGCDSKTLMLVHIRPNEDDLCETICTLGFATRVRSVRLENEEPPEEKARKEHLLTELEWQVSHLEQDCEDITRKIKRLEETIEHLKGPQSSVSTNFVASHPLIEDLKADVPNNTKNSKNRREVSSRLPSFMKPTASSQQRIGLTKHIPVSNRTKPPVPPKRRPSSVYADSVRLPVNPTTWQSECSSECSISMTSDMNWIPTVQDGTDCSQQDTSEYETKQVIFSEHEKLLPGQLTSLVECQLAESGKMQNKTEEMGIIDIDSWIHQQIIENTGICQRVLDIPEITGHGTYNSSTASPIQMGCIKGGKQAKDEASSLKLQPPMPNVDGIQFKKNVDGIKQAKVINQFTSTESFTPPSKELCSNANVKEHKNEKVAYPGSFRRSLQEKLDKCMPGQPDKESKIDPIIQPEIRVQDEKTYIGKATSTIRGCATKKIYFKIKGHYTSIVIWILLKLVLVRLRSV
ncbi:hypothetical protein HU200_057015 [Digitaria exilis]|uniref:Kinesin motor domain-containing protein n=1 Tax=Digitaria exilis TaxID=1010633 RepID=A0A835E1Y0_9POAL|nr:hypothetical protein HU200_057015 [Digitaria exilis]